MIQPVEDPRSSARRLLEKVSKEGFSGSSTTLAETVRANATRWILGVYAASIVCISVLIFLSGCHSGDYDKAASSFFEVIKVAVLPVVTFVLGRYFSSER